ncbi:LamG-like jellyroll fold domain-containing protein [Fibrella sp. WM1]|uniref:LamG domain-containing protein n=1 Tax=Fibrella musci TaxID=3242485 RepID=UPI0035227E02
MATLLVSISSLSTADVSFTTPGSEGPPHSEKPKQVVNSRSTSPPKTKSRVTNDPIRFTIQGNKQTASVGEPVELTISAELLDIPSSLMFFTEEASAFRIKVLLPTGFVITGGTYRDYIGDKLSLKNKARVSYTLQGVFESVTPNMCFRLLRSGGQADQNSTFVEKTGFCVRGTTVDEPAAYNALADRGNTAGAPNARLDNCSSLSLAVTANPTSVGTGGQVTLTASCQGCTSNGYTSGQALSFDGIDDQVDAGWYYANISNNFTVETWVKPTQPLGANGFSDRYALHPVYGGGIQSAAYTGVGLAVGTNGIRVYEHSDNYLNSQLEHLVSVSDWTHVAVVYENNVPKLYINGTLVKTGTASGRIPKPGVALGGYNLGHYAGSMDEVRLWSVSRTGAQIAAAYQQTLGSSEANLAGYWRFEETGNTAFNTISSGMQGNLQNGTSRVTGLSGSGSAATYAWTALQPNSSITFPNQASTPVTVPSTAGTYTYRVTLTSGTCTLTYDVPVNVTGGNCSGITLGAVASSTTVNANGQVTLTASCQGCTSNGYTSGQALSFDGIDDQVDAGWYYANISNNFTVETWVKPTQPLGANGFSDRYALHPVYGGGIQSAAYTGVGLAVGTNGIRVYEHSDNYLNSQLEHLVSVSDWTHVAVVYENNVPKLYINGTLVKTGTASGRIPKPGVALGGYNLGHYAGSMDEVRLWSVSRTGAQIAAAYQQTLGSSEANLAGYWRFEETGNTAFNTISSGMQGNLQNGTSRVTGLSGSGSAATYAWTALQPNSSITFPNQASTPVTVPSTAGTYTYRVTLTSGACTSDKTVSIVVNSTPTTGWPSLTAKRWLGMRLYGFDRSTKSAGGMADFEKEIVKNTIGRGANMFFWQAMWHHHDTGNSPAGSNDAAYDWRMLDDALRIADSIQCKIVVVINASRKPELNNDNFIPEAGRLTTSEGVTIKFQGDVSAGYYHEPTLARIEAWVRAVARHLRDSPYRNALMGVEYAHTTGSESEMHMDGSYRPLDFSAAAQASYRSRMQGVFSGNLSSYNTAMGTSAGTWNDVSMPPIDNTNAPYYSFVSRYQQSGFDHREYGVASVSKRMLLAVKDILPGCPVMAGFGSAWDDASNFRGTMSILSDLNEIDGIKLNDGLWGQDRWRFSVAASLRDRAEGRFAVNEADGMYDPSEVNLLVQQCVTQFGEGVSIMSLANLNYSPLSRIYGIIDGVLAQVNLNTPRPSITPLDQMTADRSVLAQSGWSAGGYLNTFNTKRAQGPGVKVIINRDVFYDPINHTYGPQP